MEKEIIENLAKDILSLSYDEILMDLRFLDVALFSLKIELKENMGAMPLLPGILYIDPVYLVEKYRKEKNYGTHLYLHSLLHHVFLHGFACENYDEKLWNLAIDIAVENTILELGIAGARVEAEDAFRSKLRILKKQVPVLTAQKLYQYFRVYEPSKDAYQEWRELTHYDEHRFWNQKEELVLNAEEWKKIARRVKADLNSFSKNATGADAMMENVKAGTREKINYDDFLRSFMVRGEVPKVDPDNFDYIYYTYGLALYKNMPLIEPLEYAEDNRIKDFVIAIDTSASCRGKLVEAFLRKTFSIMHSTESFFSKVNVHIMQCDHEVRQDTKITDVADFDEFMKNAKLIGFGSTDFRPVFEYVEELQNKKELTQLKGLIYFTDGYGLFPSSMPDYEVAFVYMGEDEHAPQVPPWAIKIVLPEEQVEEMEEGEK